MAPKKGAQIQMGYIGDEQLPTYKRIISDYIHIRSNQPKKTKISPFKNIFENDFPYDFPFVRGGIF